MFSAHTFFIKQQKLQIEEKKQRLDISFNALIEMDSLRLSGLIKIIKTDKNINSAWKAKNRNELFLASRAFYETFNKNFEVTHFYFHDANGVNLLRVHHPDRYGDKIRRITLKKSMASQKRAYGLELGVFGQFVLRVVEPLYIDNVLAGYVELGKEIDTITQNLKTSIGIEQVIFIYKTMLNQQDWSNTHGEHDGWNDYDKIVIASETTLLSQEVLKKTIKQIEKTIKPVSIEQQAKSYIALKVPLSDISGKEVGFRIILQDITIDNARLGNTIKNIIIAGIVITTLIVFSYFVYIGKIQYQIDSAYKDLNTKITEHQLAEEALRKSRDELKTSNQELESYSYSIAHDLRTPLRAITSFSQIVAEEEAHTLSEDSRNYLDRIAAAGKKMSQLIDDILKLSRITRMELNIQKVDISIMANELKDRILAAHPGRSVEWVIQDNIQVHADARLIVRVMENLLGNAVKYTETEDDARVEFGRIRHTDEAIYYVRDNGIGFDMQYTGKLFGAFQRLHGDEYDGSGVGLATVQRIIHRHGGKVWAEAEVDRGATFYFTLSK